MGPHSRRWIVVLNGAWPARPDDNICRRARGKGCDLVKDIAELDLVLFARDIADMRRGHDVGHIQQGIGGVAQRFLVEHVDCRKARPAGTQCVHQRIRFDQAGAAGVDQDGRGLHPRQVLRLDDAARGIDQPHVQRNHVALLEERGLARCRLVTIRARLRQRTFAPPDQHFHSERPRVTGNDSTDPAIAINAAGLAADGRAHAELPVPRPQRGYLSRDHARG
jgi:hypothetical protein